MAKPLKPFVRGGGYYPSSRWTTLVYPGGYTTANGNGAEPTPLIKTVKGAIAHVTDALAMPAIGLKCEINPLQAGTGNPSPTNIRPITGWTGCNVTRTGKNLLQNKRVSQTVNGVTITKYDDGSMLLNGTATANVILPLGSNSSYNNDFAAGTYYFSGCPAGGSKSTYCMRVYDSGAITVANDIGNGSTFSNLGRGRVCIVIFKNYNAVNLLFKPMVSLKPLTYADFEPYNGNVYDITFPSEAGTVYGGTLDVTNGMLMVMEANIASYDGETLPGEWISDRDVYSAGTTPTIGAQIVYKLSNPITYQLTPQQIELFAGANNIWHNANGDTELTYYAE